MRVLKTAGYVLWIAFLMLRQTRGKTITSALFLLRNWDFIISKIKKKNKLNTLRLRTHYTSFPVLTDFKKTRTHDSQLSAAVVCAAIYEKKHQEEKKTV